MTRSSRDSWHSDHKEGKILEGVDKKRALGHGGRVRKRAPQVVPYWARRRSGRVLDTSQVSLSKGLAGVQVVSRKASALSVGLHSKQGVSEEARG